MKVAATDPILVGAGDISSCDDLSGAEATAKLIEKIPGTVFAAGDLAYPDGTDEQFAKCYAPTWEDSKIEPVPPWATTNITATERPEQPLFWLSSGRSAQGLLQL